MSDPRDMRNHMLLNAEQEAAYQQVYRLVEDGDVVSAKAVLEPLFERVWIDDFE